MLKIYKYTTPNINNGLHFYFNDFQSYLNHLAEPYMEIEQNSYQINNDVILIKTTNQNVDVNDITYVIDYNEDYYRCFHVTSANLQSGYILLNISIDYWGTYIAKCSIDDIVVNRCNRNIGVGVYDDIKQSNNYIIEDYYKLFNRDNLIIAFLVMYKTSTTSLFSNTSTTSLEWFGCYVETLTNTGAINYDSIMTAIRKISGIKNIKYGDKTADANVLKAFIIPKELAKFRTGGRYNFEFSTITGDGVLDGDGVLYPQINNIDFSMDTENLYKININENFKYFLGTKDTGIELPRLTTNFYPTIKCEITQDDIEINIGVGDKFLNVSNAFNLTLTTNGGDLTAQQKISKGISVLGSVVGGIAQITAGGVGTFTGSLAIANALIPNQSNNGTYINGGDGISTFFEFSGDIITIDNLIKPFKIKKYQSIFDETKNVRLRGANFVENIEDFDTIFNYNFLVDGTTKTFVAMDCNIHGVCLNAINEIKNKFMGGVLIEKL